MDPIQKGIDIMVTNGFEILGKMDKIEGVSMAKKKSLVHGKGKDASRDILQ